MDPVRKIADAVLYEGYLLWPYRRSAMKNQRRWTFGGVYPRSHSERHPDDRSEFVSECLVRGTVDVSVRFLHVVRRRLLRDGEPVDEAIVGGEQYLSFEEATEREVGPGRISIPAGEDREELGEGVTIVRSWEPLEGFVELTADGRQVRLRIVNETPFTGSREDALARTFCSCHAVLRTDGEFVSLTDPPEELRDEAQACRNEGLWPVLVGEPHERDRMLASPIILEDHPHVAPESPGDLFDGGEIDQLLVLNILGLTDEEKAEMRATDPRARDILERTEQLTTEQLMRLHGTFRDVRQVPR
jgi:hypothetical protein